jgi:two-component system sensor histidine kinase RstB
VDDARPRTRPPGAAASSDGSPPGRARATPLRVAAGLATAALALVALVQSLVLLAADDLTDDYVRRFMAGTVALVVEDIAPLSGPQRAARVAELDERFAYPVTLVARESLALSGAERERLARGEHVVAGVPRRVIAALPDGDALLVLGPLDVGANPEQRWRLPAELWRALGVSVGLALAVGLLAWWLLRPAWRDLRALQRAADAIAEGRFDTPIPSPRGRLFAPLAQALRATLARLAAALSTQRELTGAVSHELRTPLARLRFGLDALAAEPDADARQAAAAGCERDIEELEALVDASLTFARLDSGALRAEPAPGDLGALLATEARALQPLLAGCRLEVQASLAGDVSFDARLLPYALRNGLRNAARHARGEVRLLAWREDDGAVCVAVDDDGPGVPPPLREAAFEPFRRLEGEREKRSRGYGLGLAIVRRVALAHGGLARLEASPAGGARLLLRWPG